MAKDSFEWDAEKDLINQLKQGVSFKLAQYAFADRNQIIARDLSHGNGEERFFCFGRVGDGVMTVRFTYRSGAIRIFGAGYWRKGKRIYGQKNKIH